MNKLLALILASLVISNSADNILTKAFQSAKPTFTTKASNWYDSIYKFYDKNSASFSPFAKKVWTNNLGKSLVYASPFYAAALYQIYKFQKNKKYSNDFTLDIYKDFQQKSNGLNATLLVLLGALVQVNSYAYLNR